MRSGSFAAMACLKVTGTFSLEVGPLHVFTVPRPCSAKRENVSMILESVRDFCARNVDAAKIDREHEIPASVLQGMKELGLFAFLTKPVGHGELARTVRQALDARHDR